jgi:hypothetical protein
LAGRHRQGGHVRLGQEQFAITYRQAAIRHKPSVRRGTDILTHPIAIRAGRTARYQGPRRTAHRGRPVRRGSR